MASILDNIRSMREKAKASEVRYFTSKYGASLSLKDLKEGKTIMRVAPSHTEEFPSPFVPFRSTYLEVELEIDQMQRYNMISLIKEKKLEKKFGVDDTKDIKDDVSDESLKSSLKKFLGESFTMKVNKRVFISTLHGKEGSKDLVEEYIKFVIKKVSEVCQDKDERQKLLSPINGWKDKQGTWHSGIKPSTNYVCYVWDWDDSSKPFYKLEFYDDQMNDIESKYQKFDTPEDPLTIDPFSHPKEGIGLQFERYKDDKGKWKVRVEDAPYVGKKGMTWTDFQNQFTLTAEQLTQLDEVKSLQELYGRGSFKASDFKIQMSGLILFDEKNGFGTFEDNEFLEIVEEIANQYTEEQQVEEKKQEIKDHKADKDLDKLFSKKPGLVQKAEAEKEIKGTGTKLSELRNKLAKPAVKAPEPPVEEQEENDIDIEPDSFKEEVEQEESAPTPSTTGMSLQDRLAMLKKNMNKK